MPKLPRYLSPHPDPCITIELKHSVQQLDQSPNWDVLFLSSLSSLVKSSDTGNGVTFRSGDNVDLGPSHIGVSFIDTAMQMVSPGMMLISG